MDSQTPEDQEPHITEPSPAPEIFVEGYANVGLGGGIAKFAMFSLAHVAPGQLPEQRIVLRLAMPLGAVIGMHEAMGRLIEGLKSGGQIVQAPPAPRH